VRLSKKSKAFLKHLKRLFPVMSGILNDFEALKTFSEMWRLLIKNVRLFEEIFKEMEALKLFQSFLNIISIEMRLFYKGIFQRIRGFLKLFLDKWRFFS
jgi:hypothetical protein